MSKTYFVQECPTCGRSLEVRVEYLGRTLSCQHCRGRFVAVDPATCADSSATASLSGIDLLRRADELLAQADQRRV